MAWNLEQDQMRVGECPGCKGVLSFELLLRDGGLVVTAGHGPPSCDWYKAFPDSESVARAVGLLVEKQ